MISRLVVSTKSLKKVCLRLCSYGVALKHPIRWSKMEIKGHFDIRRGVSK